MIKIKPTAATTAIAGLERRAMYVGLDRVAYITSHGRHLIHLRAIGDSHAMCKGGVGALVDDIRAKGQMFCDHCHTAAKAMGFRKVEVDLDDVHSIASVITVHAEPIEGSAPNLFVNKCDYSQREFLLKSLRAAINSPRQAKVQINEYNEEVKVSQLAKNLSIYIANEIVWGWSGLERNVMIDLELSGKPAHNVGILSDHWENTIYVGVTLTKSITGDLKYAITFNIFDGPMRATVHLTPAHQQFSSAKFLNDLLADIQEQMK